MTDDRTRLLLEDMLSNATFAVDEIGGLPVDVFTNVRTKVYAVARAIEIVGEAASQIPTEVRQAMPSIPWRHAINMRNKLIHGCRSLQPATLYETIRDDLPPLIAELERILAEGAEG